MGFRPCFTSLPENYPTIENLKAPRRGDHSRGSVSAQWDAAGAAFKKGDVDARVASHVDDIPHRRDDPLSTFDRTGAAGQGAVSLDARVISIETTDRMRRARSEPPKKDSRRASAEAAVAMQFFGISMMTEGTGVKRSPEWGSPREATRQEVADHAARVGDITGLRTRKHIDEATIRGSDLSPKALAGIALENVDIDARRGRLHHPGKDGARSLKDDGALLKKHRKHFLTDHYGEIKQCLSILGRCNNKGYLLDLGPSTEREAMLRVRGPTVSSLDIEDAVHKHLNKVLLDRMAEIADEETVSPASSVEVDPSTPTFRKRELQALASMDKVFSLFRRTLSEASTNVGPDDDYPGSPMGAMWSTGSCRSPKYEAQSPTRAAGRLLEGLSEETWQSHSSEDPTSTPQAVEQSLLSTTSHEEGSPVEAWAEKGDNKEINSPTTKRRPTPVLCEGDEAEASPQSGGSAKVSPSTSVKAKKAMASKSSTPKSSPAASPKGGKVTKGMAVPSSGDAASVAADGGLKSSPAMRRLLKSLGSDVDPAILEENLREYNNSY